jgi:putative ABC transport system permease protein
MRGLIQSLRYTLRVLLKSPGFTITAVLILGLGIGANIAVFSLVEAVILNATPFPQPDRLVRLCQPQTTADQSDVTKGYLAYPGYVDFSRDQHSFEIISASYWDFLDLSGRGDAQRLTAIFASPGLFKVTNLPFILGRPFTEAEDQTGGPLMVVLSEPLWRSRFNADPNIIGQNLTLSGESFQVVGVCRRQAEDVTTPWLDQIYVPLHVSEVFGVDLKDRGSRGLMCLGRLKAGVTPAQAQADLAVIEDNLASKYSATDKGYTIRLFPLLDAMVSTYSTIIWSLGAAVGCLLLVSCANVASLFFARGLERRKDTMIRATIGASRMRLMIQVLLEAAVPAMGGGALGVGIAVLAILFIRVFGPDYLYRFQEVRLDPVALLFVLGITGLVALLAGIPPAVSLSKVNLGSALKDEDGRGGTIGQRRQRIQSLLVIGQVALACVLLIGAMLLVRSFMTAQNLPLGFNSDHLLTATINPTAKKYQDTVRLRSFFDAVLEKVRRLPGVADAAMNDQQPFEWTFGDPTFPFQVTGQPPVEAGKEPTMCLQGITPGYFRTMQIPLLAGRDFASTDRTGGQNVMIIDAALAQHFFPGQDPIGKQIVYLQRKSTWTIVGVAQNARHNAADHGLAPFQTYIPANQDPDLYRQFLLLRATGDPLALIPAIRKVVAEVDPDIPVTRMVSSDENISTKSGTSRLGVLLTSIFSGVALFLSAVGIYSILAYAVSQRRREIGVRIALGAQSTNILSLVIRQGLKLVGIGLVIGMLAALVLVRFIASILYGVSGNDPLTLGLALLILGFAALLACLLPALRAVRINPITALRE